MLANFRARFIDVSNTDELIQNVLDLLPLSEESCKVANVKGSVKRFTALVNCKNHIDPDEFHKEFARKNDVTLRKLTPKYPKNEFSKVIYFRCQHNTRYQPTMSVAEVRARNPSGRNQNTNCPFSLALKYYRAESPDGYQVAVHMEWDHNHSVSALQSLSFKDIPDDVADMIKSLFEKGYTAAPAYAEFHRQKRAECLLLDELEQLIVMADRSKVPRRPDFNYLYTDYHRVKYGTLNLSQMYSKLSENVDKYMLESPDSKVLYQKYDEEANDPFILVVITPLMRRVHEKMATSAELAFFDSSGGMEEYNLRLFLMVTHSPIGALPLGVIITSDETLETLVSALEMFMSCLPEGAFYGRGRKGPAVIMTDNCSELRDALRAIWPDAVLLLCVFHLMQQFWRWLFDKKNGILIGDRQEIIGKFKQMVYANDDEEAEDGYTDLKDSISNYPNLIVYLEDLYAIKDTWCLSSRKDLVLRGNNTNNYVEAQFLVLKDTVLNRTKEVNVNGLFEKLTTDFNNHYRTKLLNAAAGSFDGIYSSRFKGKSKSDNKVKTAVGFQLPPPKEHKRIVATIAKNGKSLFTVPSFTDGETIYDVDMDTGMCTCFIGSDGSVCKHQYFVWVYKHKESVNFIPYLSPNQRKEYSYIATGKVLPDEYYEGLHDQVLKGDGSSQESTTESVVDIPEAIDDDAVVISTDEQQDEALTLIGRGPIDQWTVQECQPLLAKTHDTLANLIEARKDDQNFLKGLVKFCDRIEKYKTQPSRMASALHSFGNTHVSSVKSTANSLLKKARRGKKIHVQPNIRRVNDNGSRTAVVKGMTKHADPFNRTVSKKRAHSFANNVKENVAVPKKAGRTMGSRTKFKSSNTASTDSVVSKRKKSSSKHESMAAKK